MTFFAKIAGGKNEPAARESRSRTSENDPSHRRPLDPDADLVRLARAGNMQAFEQLVARHQRAIYALVSRMVYLRDEVDDLVQDIFVQAYRALPGFRGDAAFGTWLYRVAVNMTRKRLKRMSHQNHLSLDDPEANLGERMISEESDDPQEKAVLAQQNRAVREAIDRLSEKHRLVIVLHYFEERSCEEIARILDCSVGTVWSRLHYACKKLKGELAWLEEGGR
ncbi:MAG: sigma-70 family RNA polymerase sigma factor [Armatimonadetes bacterium]|nr:sigma-70 family RNA polymerase sigma factor [Armatimonadota bacterium]